MRRHTHQARDKQRNTKAATVEWAVEGERFICPCCFDETDAVNMHKAHLHAWANGGLSVRWNVFGVCVECHLLLHHGTSQRAKQARKNLWNYAGSKYGFLPLLGTPKSRELLLTLLSSLGITSLREIRGHSETYSAQCWEQVVTSLAEARSMDVQATERFIEIRPRG